MSYAEQFFGTKQNLVLQYADNLALFGEESYVYKNPSLMKEVIANEVALLNPTTAYYAYLWARENGYKAVDYFTKGLVIAIYNSNLNATYHFVLVDFNEDGSAKFISTESCLMAPASTSTVGTDILNYEDYDIVQYLNGEINWFEKWENKPASVPMSFPTNTTNMFKNLRTKKGFLSGFDYRLKKLLKTFKEGYNFPILPIGSDDYLNKVLEETGYKTNFNNISENAHNFYVEYTLKKDTSDNVIGKEFYGYLIDEVTADQITNYPMYRAGFQSHTDILETLEQKQQNGNPSTPQINYGSMVILKIQF